MPKIGANKNNLISSSSTTAQPTSSAPQPAGISRIDKNKTKFTPGIVANRKQKEVSESSSREATVFGTPPPPEVAAPEPIIDSFENDPLIEETVSVSTIVPPSIIPSISRAPSVSSTTTERQRAPPTIVSVSGANKAKEKLVDRLRDIEYDPFDGTPEPGALQTGSEARAPSGIAEAKKTVDENGETVYNVPLLTIQELIDVKFTQGKASTLFEKAIDEMRKAKKRRLNGEPEPTASPLIEKPQVTEFKEPPAPKQGGGPKLRIVNGKIELDTESLFVQQQEAASENLEVVSESTTRYITSASFGKRASRMRWNKHSTGLFYQGLSYFGTDFSMVSLFINCMNQDQQEQVTRRHVKLKFDQEERLRANMVTLALLYKKTPDDELFERMRNHVRMIRNKAMGPIPSLGEQHDMTLVEEEGQEEKKLSDLL